MPASLPSFLRKRSASALAYIVRETDLVTAEEAHRGRRTDWPDHRWGIGQDGSIAGIVYHVCAWKTMTLPLFQPNGRALTRAEFDPSSAAVAGDWTGLVDWLRSIGAEWNEALEAVPDEELDATRQWEGESMTVAEFAFEMIQHDIQHAAQIEYLRQLHSLML